MTNTDLLNPLGQGSASDALLNDPAWLQACVEVELALVRSLVGHRVVPDWMSEVADSLEQGPGLDVAAVAAASRSGGNPIIPLVKQLGIVADRVHAGASDFLHLGATSQDILDSAAILIARRVIGETSARLGELVATLSRLAALHRGTPMAGRTLGQHAAPTTFGLVVAGWLDGVLGARVRLEAVGSSLPVQYGGSVGTRAVLLEAARDSGQEATPDFVVAAVLADFAGHCGLKEATPWHTNRLPVVELGAALAAVVGAIGAMAAELNVLSRTEIAEVSERLGTGEGGSSAMPHKRNPVTSVLLVSAARRSPGLAATLFDAQVSEDQRPSGAWHSEWQTLRDLERLAIDSSTAAADLAGRLEVDVARMRSNLDFTDGLIYSERVTAILTESMGKTAAFALVSDASRESVHTSRPLQVVIAARIASDHNAVLRARVLSAFDPDTAVGASGAIIDAVLARVKELS